MLTKSKVAKSKCLTRLTESTNDNPQFGSSHLHCPSVSLSRCQYTRASTVSLWAACFLCPCRCRANLQRRNSMKQSCLSLSLMKDSQRLRIPPLLIIPRFFWWLYLSASVVAFAVIAVLSYISCGGCIFTKAKPPKDLLVLTYIYIYIYVHDYII